MKKTFAFDIGIASIGWAVVNKDLSRKKGNIERCGVFTFPEGENPKDGKSLAEPRREARGQRRVIKRKKRRLAEIKKLLKENNFDFDPRQEGINKKGEEKYQSVWFLRAKALDQKLSNDEFGRVLYHLAKKRGYSSSEVSIEDSDSGVIKDSIKKLLKEFADSGNKTIGQYLFNKYYNKKGEDGIITRVRNHPSKYNLTIDSSLIIKEINQIISKQKEFGLIISEDFSQKYKEIQKRKEQMQDMLEMAGYCSFEKKEKRAPQSSITFERFRALQILNNLQISDLKTGEVFEISPQQKKQIIIEAIKKSELKYSHIRKILNIAENFKFNNIRQAGKKNKDIKEQEKEKNTCFKFKFYYDLQKALKDQINAKDILLNEDIIDKIGLILSSVKDEKRRREKLEKLEIKPNLINAIIEIKASKFGHLSIKAIKKINNFLLEGKTYDKACQLAGYDFKDKIPDKIENVTNPVVRRVFYKYKKLLKFLCHQFGYPDQINIETARELSKSHKERRKIDELNKNNQSQNEEIIQTLEEYKIKVNGKNITKLKLWRSQQSKCPYSSQIIEVSHLQDDSALQIDHIIPYHRCYDDSINNKVLCFTKENQQKTGKTPQEYLEKDPQKWSRFTDFVINNKNFSKRKKDNLLIRDLDEEIEKSFQNRNLNDTRYVNRLIAQNTPDLLNDKEGKIKVRTISGVVTASIRKSYGLQKDRQQDNKHHAQDAIILAIISQGFVQKINISNKIDKIKNKLRLAEPWEGFKDEIQNNIDKTNVVRFPRKKVKGASHEETIYSIKKNLNENEVIKSIDIDKLEKKHLEKIYDKEGGAKIIYQQLKEFFADKAEDKFILKNNSGEKINTPKRIKIIETSTNNRQINRGIVAPSNMVRVDVYGKNNKKNIEEFFAVPVYAIDIINGKKPTKIAPFKKNLKIDDSYNFKFSLFADDIVYIENKKGEMLQGYYKKFGISSAAIDIKSINGDAIFRSIDKKTKEKKESSEKPSIGIQNLKIFKKQQIDYLGNISDWGN